MSSRQLKHNTKTEGGFLCILAGLTARALPLVAKTVLPALGVGALSGLASKKRWVGSLSQERKMRLPSGSKWMDPVYT